MSIGLGFRCVNRFVDSSLFHCDYVGLVVETNILVFPTAPSSCLLCACAAAARLLALNALACLVAVFLARGQKTVLRCDGCFGLSQLMWCSRGTWPSTMQTCRCISSRRTNNSKDRNVAPIEHQALWATRMRRKRGRDERKSYMHSRTAVYAYMHTYAYSNGLLILFALDVLSVR